MASRSQLGFDFAPAQPAKVLPIDICANKHQGNAQSVKANPSAEFKATLRERVRIFIAACDFHGATVKEIAATFGKPMHAISGRVSELKAENKVWHSGRVRDGGAVLVGRTEWARKA